MKKGDLTEIFKGLQRVVDYSTTAPMIAMTGSSHGGASLQTTCQPNNDDKQPGCPTQSSGEPWAPPMHSCSDVILMAMVQEISEMKVKAAAQERLIADQANSLNELRRQ